MFLRPTVSLRRVILRLNPLLLIRTDGGSIIKWVGISSLIGVICGGGSIAFYAAIRLTNGLFLGKLGGYVPPSPAGEGLTRVLPFWSSAHLWLIPVITTLGGLVAGLLVSASAPEAGGGGQDAAIADIHYGKPVRARVPLVKLLASAIIIGTGGSAGREGPIAQISVGLGSILARFLHLNEQDRRNVLIASVGAGVGSIFRAPFGGALLAVEILYRRDMEVEALIPTCIASSVGYCLFSAVFGWNPIFATPTHLLFSSLPQLLYYVPLGILCGLFGRLYASIFQRTGRLFQQLLIPGWLKPALGGLGVGLLSLALPQVLGTSYGWLQLSMGLNLLTLPLWAILLFPCAKMLTTSLSIGSGGSGGIFGPGIVIGGMTGALLWRLTYQVLPGIPALPAPFVIVGMMALFGSIARAPIAVILMVAEMTGNLSLLAPAMIAVSLAYLFVGKQTIYPSQPETRRTAPTHTSRPMFPRLSTLTIGQAMASLSTNDFNANTKHSTGLILPANLTLEQALEILASQNIHWAVVRKAEDLAAREQLLGIISITSILEFYNQTLNSDVHKLPTRAETRYALRE